MDASCTVAVDVLQVSDSGGNAPGLREVAEVARGGRGALDVLGLVGIVNVFVLVTFYRTVRADCIKPFHHAAAGVFAVRSGVEALCRPVPLDLAAEDVGECHGWSASAELCCLYRTPLAAGEGGRID